MPAGTFLPPGLTTSDVKIASGGTDNYVMTAVDGETIQGEANLTFSGSALTVIGTLTVGVSDTGHDVQFFGATANTYMLWDENTDDLVLTLGAELYFYDAAGGEHIKSNGTDMTIYAGTDLNLTAGTDINIPVDVGLTFGNDGEKIEGDGADLTISGNIINLNGAVDMNSNTLSNIGASGNNWAQNSLTLAGGTSTQTLNVGDATNPDDARIRLFTKAGAAGENSIVFIEGSGNGDDNNNAYKLRYNTSADRIEFSTQDSDGGSTAADIYRIPDGQTTIDANATWDDNVFDDHDDAMVLSPYREGILNLRARNDELIRIGVLRRYEDGWVGYSDQRMAALLAGGIYQNRHRMDAQHDAMDERLAKIEAAIGV